MKSSAAYPSMGKSSRQPSPGRSSDARRYSFDRRVAKAIVIAVVSGGALFVLIAFLDGVGRQDDISPGAALAARPATPSAVDAVRGLETWAADTTAAGTRPDAIH